MKAGTTMRAPATIAHINFVVLLKVSEMRCVTSGDHSATTLAPRVSVKKLVRFFPRRKPVTAKHTGFTSGTAHGFGCGGGCFPTSLRRLGTVHAEDADVDCSNNPHVELLELELVPSGAFPEALQALLRDRLLPPPFPAMSSAARRLRDGLRITADSEDSFMLVAGKDDCSTAVLGITEAGGRD